MNHANSRDTQIVRRETNALLPPLLVARFRLSCVRQDGQSSNVSNSLLEQLIRAVDADSGFARFGLPDDV
jgi:hypothetical protein